MRDQIAQAIKILNQGGTILYPTDTIWGIGCDATNEEAVSRIYEIKQRSDSKSMLVLLDSENRLPSYISEVPDIAWELIEASPEALTIIYPGAKNLAKNLISPEKTIGIRITDDAFCSGLLRSFKKPIVSTSANISGKPSPEIFLDISQEIKEAVDHIVNWRQDETTPAKPSSIIQIGLSGEIKILRK